MENVRISGLDNIGFGNLDGLAGTWTNNTEKGLYGYNLIAVPNQQGGFTLLVDQYYETLVINKIAATTPNRGLNGKIAQLPTLQYQTQINKQADNSLMHVENGFWELLMDKDANNGNDIFRIANIPHGNSLLAMGTSSSILGGAPVFDNSLSAIPIGKIPPGETSGYTDGYGYPLKYADFNPRNPNAYLSNYLAGQIKAGRQIKESVTLKVSTQNNGGINNIFSVDMNTNTTQFDATFWLITYSDNSKDLLYSQNTLIEFPVSGGKDGLFPIIWPHVNVNILTLQPLQPLQPS